MLGWGCTGGTSWGSVNWDKYFEQYLVTVLGKQHWYTTGDNYWGSTGTALRQYWETIGGVMGGGQNWGQHWGSNGTVLKHKSLAMQSKVLLNMPPSPLKCQIRYSSVVREACG